MTSKQNPEYYMKLAIREAEKARGLCSPNPFVGAVIVKNNVIIGKGHTQPYGKDHAEIQALKQAGSNAKSGDIYVTLEPCSHWGKTPPCTEAIIAAGIQRVFYGINDPNPMVNPDCCSAGPGIISMRKAGIDVSGGYLSSAISRQLEYFICRMREKRPFVTLKAALSLDGKYAAEDGTSRWISASRSRIETHRMRERHDAILTGINTVLNDDPELTVRLPRPKRQPLRVVLDPELLLPVSSRLIQTINVAELIVLTAQDKINSPQANRLQELGAEVMGVEAHKLGLNLRMVMSILHDRGCYSVMAECGSHLASALVKEALLDKLVCFYGPKLIGGTKSMFAELEILGIANAISVSITDVKRLSPDFMITAYPIY